MILLKGKTGYIYYPKYRGARLGKLIIPDPIDSRLDFGREYDFSIEFWIRTSNKSFSIVSKLDGGTLGYQIRVSYDGHLVMFTGSGAKTLEKHGERIIADGNWHHVVCFRDSKFGNSIYVDGQKDGLLEGGKVSSLANSSPLIIGDGKQQFDLAYLKMYRVALKKHDIKLLYSLDFPDHLNQELLAQWTFDKDVGKTVHDLGDGACCGKLTDGHLIPSLAQKHEAVIAIGDGKTKRWKLPYNRTSFIHRVFIDGKLLSASTQYHYSPDGVLQLSVAPNKDQEVAVVASVFPITYKVAELFNWKVAYNYTVAQVGVDKDCCAKTKQTKLNWTINTDGYFIYKQNAYFGGPFCVVRLCRGNEYLNIWTELAGDAKFGPGIVREKRLDTPLSFVGEGGIIKEKEM